jgi:hypothetical protein
METKKSTPISDIDNIMEMLELFKLLQISHKGRDLNLEAMKKKAREKIQEQINSSNGATVNLNILIY